MNQLWSYDQLEAFCNHPEPEIRTWAIKRMSFIFAEHAAPVALRLLDDTNELVKEAAADHFCQFPDQHYAEILLKSFREARGVIEIIIAKALVAMKEERVIDEFQEKYSHKNGNDLPAYVGSMNQISKLSTDKMQNICGNTIRKIIDNFKDCYQVSLHMHIHAAFQSGLEPEPLLELILNKPNDVKLWTICAAEIARHCGSSFTLADYENSQSEIFEAAADIIHWHGLPKSKIRLLQLWKEKNYKKIIENIFNSTFSFYEKAMNAFGEQNVYEWYLEKGKPRQNFHTIGFLFKFLVKPKEGNPLQMHEKVMRIAALLSTDIYARLTGYSLLVGKRINKMNSAQLLELFLMERSDIEEDEKIENLLLQSPDQSWIADQCIIYLQQHTDSSAGLRIIDLFGKMLEINKLKDATHFLPAYDDLWDRLVHALLGCGEISLNAVQWIIEQNESSKLRYALDVIEKLSIKEAADLLIANWNMLCSSDKVYLMAAVKNIADPRFIELIENNLMEGEPFDADVLQHLYALHNIAGPRTERAIKMKTEYYIKMQRRDELQRINSKQFLKESVELFLKCRNCHAIYFYEIHKVITNYSANEFHIQDTVACKNCNALNNFEFTRIAISTITERIIQYMRIKGVRLKDIKKAAILSQTKPNSKKSD